LLYHSYSILRSNSETLSRVLKANLSIHMTPPAGLQIVGLRCFSSRVAAYHMCEQCSRVPLFLFKGSLMISGTDSRQCGKMLKERKEKNADNVNTTGMDWVAETHNIPPGE